MATGYIVTGRGDLDALFKARSSAAAANTGFLSNGGVDLAQRFEPRGATTAIAATGFKNGATDLASIFMDFAAAADPVLITRTMTVGTTGSPAFSLGWRNTASGYEAMTGQAMSATPEWTKASQLYRLDEWEMNGPTKSVMIRVSTATVTPANTDAVWQWMALTGIFQASGGVSVRRLVTRASVGVTNTHTTPNGRPGRSYQGLGTIGFWEVVNGNSYTLEIG